MGKIKSKSKSKGMSKKKECQIAQWLGVQGFLACSTTTGSRETPHSKQKPIRGKPTVTIYSSDVLGSEFFDFDHVGCPCGPYRMSRCHHHEVAFFDLSGFKGGDFGFFDAFVRVFRVFGKAGKAAPIQ